MPLGANFSPLGDNFCLLAVGSVKDRLRIKASCSIAGSFMHCLPWFWLYSLGLSPALCTV